MWTAILEVWLGVLFCVVLFFHGTLKVATAHTNVKQDMMFACLTSKTFLLLTNCLLD